MSQYSQQFANWNKKYNKHKEKYDEISKRKSDLLFLNQGPEGENWTWPIKVSGKNQKKAGPITTVDSSSSTTAKSKSRFRQYIAKPYDPLFRESKKERKTIWNAARFVQRKKNRQAESREYMDLFLDKFLSHDLKPKPARPLSEDTAAFIKDQSADMLDKVLLSIANARSPIQNYKEEEDEDEEEEQEDEEKNKNTVGLDWEFVLGNLAQVGLSPSVIDRVKRRMALITGKNTPAISVMNVVQPLILSDLLITSAEVQAQKDLKKLIKKSQKFESRQEGDEPFKESMQWLIDLSLQKDQDNVKEEMEKIHQDYTNRVLDLKPAFF